MTDSDKYLDIFRGGGKAVNKDGILVECYIPKICKVCEVPNIPVSKMCYRCKNRLNK